MIATAFPLYILWHYTEGVRAAFQLALNFIRFIFNFFSLPLLVKTFFSPFRRMSEQYAKGLAPEQWFETLIVNTLMRIVGMVMRTVLILAGLIALLLTILFCLAFILIWVFLPMIIMALVIGGLFLFI